LSSFGVKLLIYKAVATENNTNSKIKKPLERFLGNDKMIYFMDIRIVIFKGLKIKK